ncbi:MAG: nucleotide exchange factor GrpE [Moraxellaceae bacterium]|nr:MAG: nucleotide exchange factor GrpE [Moraxellaceae bacterium]
MSNDDVASTEQEEPVVAEVEVSDVDAQVVDGAEADVADVEAAAEDQAAEDVEDAEEANVSISDLESQLAASQAKVQDQQDSVLRAQAEMQNVRRRAERDVTNAHKFALDKFASDLLPVVDTLERALQSAAESDETTREGVELTLKMLTDTLKKHGVEQLDPTGEPFDPEMHQAMSMQPNPDMEPNTVMAVLQKGYSLGGRLVRPAMVIVSQA